MMSTFGLFIYLNHCNVVCRKARLPYLADSTLELALGLDLASQKEHIQTPLKISPSNWSITINNRNIYDLSNAVGITFVVVFFQINKNYP